MKKRMMGLFLALALCLTLLPAAALAADLPAGISGAGTKEDPYRIGTAEQLYTFAAWYNANAEALPEDETNIYAELTADVDLNEGMTFTADGYTGNGSPRKWMPIGYIDSGYRSLLPYLGEFNGNGHTISGLYINEQETTLGTIGMFGYFVGYLHDLNITNAYISSKSACTGSFAGIMGGTIENCIAEAIVRSDAEENTLSGTGGIVGNLNDVSSQALNCAFFGLVSSKGNPYTGGIVGDNLYGYIAGCVNNGSVSSDWDKVGGIVGQNQVAETEDEPVEGRSSIIERCVNNGMITGAGSNVGDYVGGIVGMSSWNFDNSYIGAVKDCLNTGEINGSASGGIIGNLEASTKVENCINTGAVTGQPSGAVAGIHFASCTIADCYYIGAEGLTAVGRLGGTDGTGLPSEDEMISDDDAAVPAEKISSGEISWKLNTKAGTIENRGVWAVEDGSPLLASEDVKATYRVIFDLPEDGADDIIVYTPADGKAAIPAEAAGRALTYSENDQTKTFTANTIVTADITVTVSDKLPEEDSSSDSDPSYPVSAPAKTPNGTVTVSPKNASRGDTVTITAKPDSGYTIGTVTVTDDRGNQLELTDKGDGKYTFVMPGRGVSVKATFTEDNSAPDFFRDVPNGAYFYDAVKWAVEKGVTNGKTETLFAPDDSCTRAEIVTFLWRAAGSPVVNYAMDLEDVKGDEYYAEAVRWALSLGITKGTDEKHFSPDDTCTRAQAVTFLYRAMGESSEGRIPFTDVPAGSYYEEAVNWATANGVTNGMSAGIFAPDEDCTRAQIVTFLFRAYNNK